MRVLYRYTLKSHAHQGRLFSLCVLLAVCIVYGASISVQPSSLDSAKKSLVTQKYDSAKAILLRSLAHTPENTEALYLLVANEQTRILDYESYLVDGKQFELYADSIRKVFGQLLPRLHGADSLRCLLYIANIDGGVSVIEAKTGNWFDGVKNGLSSISILKQVKAAAPHWNEANLGIGIFEYYLCTSLKWLPFIDANGEKGIDCIRKAINAGYPYNFAAKNSYCWILIEQSKFDLADSIAASVLVEIPGNTIFIRIRALIALWTQQYKKALPLAQKLIAISEKRSPVNWSDLVSGYYVLASSYDNLNMRNECLQNAEKILSRTIPPEYRDIPHIKKNLSHVAEIQEKNSVAAR
jgi:tetratricopeptide (TPR) repeat protein